MKVNAIFPQLEIGTDPATIALYAREIERIGYDGVVVFDHVLGAHPERDGGWGGPYVHTSMFHEPLVLYGYLAAVTTRLELVTGVIVLPQRQTALVAKQAAEVDVLSHGRLRLGVGIGWNEVEYESLGVDFRTRASRIEEQVAVLRLLWQEPVVEFSGQWHHISRAGLNPLPVQRPIPVWLGGGYRSNLTSRGSVTARAAGVVEPALRRIARIADGWSTHARPGDDGRIAIERFRRFVLEAGRDPATVGLEGAVSSAAMPPADWPHAIAWWQAMGASHIGLSTMGVKYRSVDEHLEALSRFIRMVRG